MFDECCNSFPTCWAHPDRRRIYIVGVRTDLNNPDFSVDVDRFPAAVDSTMDLLKVPAPPVSHIVEPADSNILIAEVERRTDRKEIKSDPSANDATKVESVNSYCIIVYVIFQLVNRRL